MNLNNTALAIAPTLPVKVLPMSALLKNAHSEYKRQTGLQPDGLAIGIIVNFIRHKLTGYDKLMDTSRKHKNGFEQRAILRRAILMSIAREYCHEPQIVHEARRQLTKIEEIDARAEEQPIRTWRADS